MTIKANEVNGTDMHDNDYERESTKQFKLMEVKNSKHIPAAGAAPPAVAAPPEAAGAATAPPAGTEVNLERPEEKKKKKEKPLVMFHCNIKLHT